MILMIETSGKTGSVALAGENGTCLHQLVSARENAHAEEIPGMVQQICAMAGIQLSSLRAIAVNQGPGSYTGLRIGTSLAKGLCYGLNIPLLAADGLQAMAEYAAREGHQADIYICMVDARRDEVFTATYDRAFSMTEPLRPVILQQDSWERWHGRDVVICGDSGEKSGRLLSADSGFRYADVLLRAAMFCPMIDRMYKAGTFADLAYFEPEYGKEFMAGITKKFTV